MANSQLSDPFGFLTIDKPAGMTSHAVVSTIRRHLKVKKVGHAGTLDPMATGVLVICLGHATRLSEYAMTSTKRYVARVRLGIVTDTYDAEGQVVSEVDASHICREDVERVLPNFTGELQQIPPIYSAIKKGGRKLYDLARAGETVELEPRAVTIHQLTLIEWDAPEFVLDVVCSAGTYIRSLAHDIGQLLGVGGYLIELTRTMSGSFQLADALQLDALVNDENWMQFLISPDVVVQQLPAVYLHEVDTDHVLHGRVPEHPAPVEDGLIRAYNSAGQFFALLQVKNAKLHPYKVFPYATDKG
ncbi:MAG: tRNA pseudouridine(55) synthase TruB [Chloroflexi bacterium]|nr:MAG: tRNA pseudouridine(55) synthase TruB [Chloroflexota bacterium]